MSSETITVDDFREDIEYWVMKSGGQNRQIVHLPAPNSESGTVTVDMWDSPDDQHVSLELRIEETDARELGTRLIEAAARAREIEAQDRDP